MYVSMNVCYHDAVGANQRLPCTKVKGRRDAPRFALFTRGSVKEALAPFKIGQGFSLTTRTEVRLVLAGCSILLITFLRGLR